MTACTQRYHLCETGLQTPKERSLQSMQSFLEQMKHSPRETPDTTKTAGGIRTRWYSLSMLKRGQNYSFSTLPQKEEKFITWCGDNHHLNTEYRSAQTLLCPATVQGPALFCLEIQLYNAKNNKSTQGKRRRGGRSSHWSSLLSLFRLLTSWTAASGGQETGGWAGLLALFLCRQGG